MSFSPSGSGTSNGTISINYNDGTSAQSTTRAIQGVGASPALLIISGADPHDFGSLSVSNSTTHAFTVTNFGGQAASALSGAGLATPFSFQGGAFPGTGGTCGATLNSGQSCTMVVEYAPTVTGSFVDSVILNYNNGVVGSQATRKLFGVAVP